VSCARRNASATGAQCLSDRDDTDLLPFGTDETYLAGTDLIVHSQLDADGPSSDVPLVDDFAGAPTVRDIR
jgi:hypothetical protein